MKLKSGKRTLNLTDRIAVVGVINATPDSYVPESRSMDRDAIVARARQYAGEGADIIEIGGESTGPGSRDISLEEESERVLPAIGALRSALPDLWISVDTCKSEVALRALQSGADMINDVTAGRGDARMFPVIAHAGCPYVLMYAKDSSPRTTVKPVQYDDIVKTIRTFLIERKVRAMAAGIRESQMIIDPGLGHFLSSDPKYSFEVINRLKELCDLGPVFLSPSRKSFLAGDRNNPPAERLPATLAVTAIAVLSGARFIRTHDILDTRRAVDAASATAFPR